MRKRNNLVAFGRGDHNPKTPQGAKLSSSCLSSQFYVSEMSSCRWARICRQPGKHTEAVIRLRLSPKQVVGDMDAFPNTTVDEAPVWEGVWHQAQVVSQVLPTHENGHVDSLIPPPYQMCWFQWWKKSLHYFIEIMYIQKIKTETPHNNSCFPFYFKEPFKEWC